MLSLQLFCNKQINMSEQPAENEITQYIAELNRVYQKMIVALKTTDETMKMIEKIEK